MSYSVENIVEMELRLSQQGVSQADFGAAVLFCEPNEATADAKDQFFVFEKSADVTSKFASTTETYKAANAFLGGIPASRRLYIWNTDTQDENWTTTLTKARKKMWWFFTFGVKSIYDSADSIKEFAAWAESEKSFFANSVSDETMVNDIRNVNKTDDLASDLVTFGYRYTQTLANKESPYAAITLTKRLAAVDYSAPKSTITAEYKELSGVKAEQLDADEQQAMENKNVAFYSTIGLQGSETTGKTINAVMSNGVHADSVCNVEAFKNSMKVALANVILKTNSKIAQTTAGQQNLISAANDVGEQYIDNGFLDERSYTNPDTGEKCLTRGFEMLSKPEDILTISIDDRAKRKSAPILVRVFEGGAIHHVKVISDLF